MPRDGSTGTYTLPSGNPVTTGTTIASTTHNNTMSDLASAITASVAKDGQTTMTGDLPMGGFKPTNVADASAATDCPVVSQTQKDYGNYVATVGGTGDAITLTASPAITAYEAGQRFWFIAGAANPGATTVNVNGLGTKNITKYGTVSLSRGDIAINDLSVIHYDGTQFVLVNPKPVLNRTSTLVDVVNTVAETTLYSFSIPANVMGTNRRLVATLFADYLNNTGANRGLTIRVKLGSTTIALFDSTTIIAPSATRRSIYLNGFVANENSASAQSSRFQNIITPGVDGSDSSPLFSLESGHNSITENSASALTISVTAEHSIADANLSIRMRTFILELV